MALTLAYLLERAFARSISLSGDVGDAEILEITTKTRSFNNHHLYVRERETEIPSCSSVGVDRIQNLVISVLQATYNLEK